MICADTSVWIDHLRDINSISVRRLRDAFGHEPIIVGDLIMLEVLQGARSESHAAAIENLLRAFIIVRMLDDNIAVKAALNYRFLRSIGFTVRKRNDIVIGTYCIEHSHELLHNDSDYEPMRAHLGLRATG